MKTLSARNVQSSSDERRHCEVWEPSRGVRQNGDAQSFAFVPGRVVLNGEWFGSEAYLSAAVTKPPLILAKPISQGIDAVWVRARIPEVFDFTPVLSSTETSLLEVGVVAVPEGASVGTPFICTDYYGRSELVFSPEGPPPNEKAEIAAAFWSLLLQAPDDLANFEERVFHPGAGVWMYFGCENGELNVRRG